MGKFKSFIIMLAVLVACLGGAAKASAGVYSFIPSPADLYDLDHYYYYTWRINWQPTAGDTIVSAKLQILNINNWAEEPNDILYMNLLDKTQYSGVHSYYDDQAPTNAFNTWNYSNDVFLTSYTDPDESVSENFLYTFTQAQINDLTAYSTNDGTFGLGFDPDCHYYNQKVKLVVTTRPIPEPATGLLFASGIFGRFLLRRKRA